MTTLLSENFTQYNGAALTSPWAGDLANTSVTAGAVKFDTAGRQVYYNVNDQNVSVQLSWTPGAASTSLVYLRKFDDANVADYIALKVNSSADTIALVIDDQLTNELTIESKAYTFNAGTTYTLRIEAKGRWLKVYVNGALQLSNHSTFMQFSGWIGFGCATGSDTLETFTNLLVTTTDPVYEQWDQVIPAFTKYASNPIYTSADMTGLTNFLWWKVINVTDYGLSPLVAGRPYLAAYADDHGPASQAGGMRFATAASPLGPWTQFNNGDAVYVDGTFNQSETYDLYWDAANSRFVVTYHTTATPSGLNQATRWGTSTNLSSFTTQGTAMPPVGSANIRSYGHTGYAQIAARLNDSGLVLLQSSLGSRQQGREAYPQSGRQGMWMTDFTTWQMVGEQDYSWIDCGKFQNTWKPFVWKGDLYCVVGEYTQGPGGQFDVSGRLAIGKFTRDLTGLCEGFVEPFTVGAATDNGQAWETSTSNVRCQGVFYEAGTFYLYYQIDQNKMGVATATVSPGDFAAPLQRNRTSGQRALSRLARGL